MRKLALATFALALSVASAFAQNVAPGEIPHPQAGAYNSSPPTCTSGQYCTIQTDVNGQLKVAGTISATIAGFTPGLTFATLTATGSSASVALPAGLVVAFQNTGTTTVSCTLGVGSATAVAGQVQVPASSTVFLTVGSNTFGACIDESGSVSNVVRLAGGTGLGTGFGGGGGGGGSSSITNWGGGVLGAMANYGTSPGAVLVPGVNAFITNTNANGQATMTNSSPVVIASNQSAVPASIDPCNDALTVKSFLPITATTSLVKVIATGTAAKKLYICQIILATTAANNVAVFEATTATTCATAAVAVYGAGTSVATAANGFPFPANGGVSLGNGLGTVGFTTVNNNDLCIGTSAATPLTGGITYATK